MIITEMLAFDRASVRQFDKVGRLQIERSNLSKANVYRTALEQTGIDIQGIHPSAYRSMVKFAVEQKQTAKGPRVAMDQASASTFAADFPGAKLKRGY